MKTPHAIALILVVWTLIYLSFLGERDLKGEEARRIIPAQEMIANEQWVVPTIAGEYYGNKPPLINWVIAASFKLTGSQSEFAARLPSAISLLSLVFAMFFCLNRPFGIKRALSVSLILLTAGSMIEKCRIAEIESIFITLFGFAVLSWIVLWTRHRSPWLIWTVPYLFIGMGCLAKGPVHLLFWAFFLLPVLRSAGALRQLFHPAHLLGIVIMVAIPLPWVVANLSAVEKPDDSVGNWIFEITKRMRLEPELLKNWAMHPFDLLINFMPWTLPLFFAIWQRRKMPKPDLPLDRWDAVTRGCLWAAALTAMALLSIPGGLPRYILPLYVPLAIAVVNLYSTLPDQPRLAYERFAYLSLMILIPLVFVVLATGTGIAIYRGLEILWLPVSISVGLLVAYGYWLFRNKTKPGVFISTPIGMAIAYLFISSVAIPFEREHPDDYRDGAAAIHELASDVAGTKVFYADSDYRNVHPKHLRLLYYLGGEFVHQGESKPLPENTSFVIGRAGSAPGIKALAAPNSIERTVEIEVDGLALKGFFLSAPGS